MKSLFAGMALAVLTAGSAAAGSYGAIYFSPTTRATGYVGNAESRQDAVDTAYDYCARNASDCVKAIEFWGGSCGAVAVGDRNGWGASWGEEMEFASEGALSACSKRTGHCKVLKYYCSTSE